jgi:hypothetical protein
MKRLGLLTATALCVLFATAQFVAAAPGNDMGNGGVGNCKGKGNFDHGCASSAPEAPLAILLPLVAIIGIVVVWAIVARVRRVRTGVALGS